MSSVSESEKQIVELEESVGQELIAIAIEKAKTNKAFLKELRDDPEKALRNHAGPDVVLNIRKNLKIHVCVKTANDLWLVIDLPSDDGDLSPTIKPSTGGKLDFGKEIPTPDKAVQA